MKRVCAALFLLTATAAFSSPNRFILSVGHNRGQASDEPLRYAQRDAERVRDLFVELGSVQLDQTKLLLAPDANELSEAFDGLRRQVMGAADAVVLVYISAHAAQGLLHLGSAELSLADVRKQLAAVPAQLRILVVDACTSGRAVRPKGAKWARPVTIAEEVALDGTIVISSSGPSEPAQEWESLQGSLFTHHWLSALRGIGDANHDGRVSVAEAYFYARVRTVSEALQQGQHPAYHFDLRGGADVVLTTPAHANSALMLDDDLEGRFVVTSEPNPELVLELQKKQAAPVRLALPPGRYRVRRFAGDNAQACHIELSWGGLHLVSASDFSASRPELISLKGRSVGRWSVSALVGLAPGVASAIPSIPFGARLRFDAGAFWVALSLGGSSHDVYQSRLRLTELFILPAAELGLSVRLDQWRLALGVVGRGLLGVQSVKYDDDSTTTRLFTVESERRPWSLGGEMGPTLCAEYFLSTTYFAGLGAEALMRLLPKNDRVLTSTAWRAWASFGFVF